MVDSGDYYGARLLQRPKGPPHADLSFCGVGASTSRAALFPFLLESSDRDALVMTAMFLLNQRTLERISGGTKIRKYLGSDC